MVKKTKKSVVPKKDFIQMSPQKRDEMKYEELRKINSSLRKLVKLIEGRR